MRRDINRRNILTSPWKVKEYEWEPERNLEREKHEVVNRELAQSLYTDD